MRVGLSFSRCLRDIATGVVDIDDVLVIIARTDFDPRDDEQWGAIWHGYRGTNIRHRSPWVQHEWSDFTDDDEAKIRNIAQELWDSGKLHQPRKFGINPPRLKYHWYDLIITPEDLNNIPAAKEAWEQYQTIASLIQ